MDVDAETEQELRQALGLAAEVKFKVVKIDCQLPEFAVGSSR